MKDKEKKFKKVYDPNKGVAKLQEGTSTIIFLTPRRWRRCYFGMHSYLSVGLYNTFVTDCVVPGYFYGKLYTHILKKKTVKTLV